MTKTDKRYSLFKHLLDEYNLSCTDLELQEILSIAEKILAQNHLGGISRYMAMRRMALQDLNIRKSDVYIQARRDGMRRIVEMAVDERTVADLLNGEIVPTLILVDYDQYKWIENELRL